MKQLATFAAIAGVGGLSQMSISNYTREQGWGMGKHVGAIPSMFGGRNIELSHVGTVFEPTPGALERWRRWLGYIWRDQLVIWMPACIIGIALPSMLSIEFIPRGTIPDDWTAAGMTATAVQERVGGAMGQIFWYIILFCGFLVLMPSTSSSADGFVRRWVDVSWTAIPWLHKWDRRSVKVLYFAFLGVYFVSGLILLSTVRPQGLLLIAGNLNNFALGFSCWHTLYVNSSLLPVGVKPRIPMRIALFFAGLYFLSIATLVSYIAYHEYFGKEKKPPTSATRSACASDPRALCVLRRSSRPEPSVHSPDAPASLHQSARCPSASIRPARRGGLQDRARA
jgi:hypothetical protein